MKKNNLLILAVAALGFAACANDETTAVNEKLAESNEISFRPYASGLMRAADAHFNAIGDAFKVTAFQTGGTTTTYFSNVVFTKQSSESNFTSETKYYWPSSTNLDFYAWSPASQSDNYASIPVTPGTDIGNQVDLVYAKTVDWGKHSTGGTPATHVIGDTYKGVTINFRHAESKVIIKLKNTNPSLKFTVQDASICNVNSTGTFAFKTANTTNTDTQNAGNLLLADWSSNTPGSYTVTLTNNDSYTLFAGNVAARDLTDAASSREMILIPQTLTKQNKYASNSQGADFEGPCIKVNLKIQNNGGGNEYIANDGSSYITAMWPLETQDWNPGYKYTYTVDLAQGGYFAQNTNDSDPDLDPVLEGAEIMFVSVSVDGWDESSIDVAGPAFAVTLLAGGTKDINVAANATGHFSIELTGIDNSALPGTPISVTTAGNIVGTPTAVRNGTTAYITGVITANGTTSPVTSKFTFTDGNNNETTININQAAAN